MITKIDALLSLTPQAKFHTNDSNIIWEDDRSQPTEAEIDAEVKRLESEFSANQYQRDRQYPSIGDQLDDLYHKGAFSDEMAAKIKKVKDDNPKG